MKSSNFDRCFITGCDANTEWMLPWFLKHYLKHNDTPIVFADFGVSDATRAWIMQVSEFSDYIPMEKQRTNGWFLKPAAMLNYRVTELCWLDTDIHVLGDLSGVWNHVGHNKLGMVQDHPWSLRRKETWHNSGVVAIKGKPEILRKWAIECQKNEREAALGMGDQEILHDMIGNDPLSRLSFIDDIPNIYNWLRIQLIDGQDNADKLAMHWTGAKGNDQIRKIMYNE